MPVGTRRGPVIAPFHDVRGSLSTYPLPEVVDRPVICRPSN
jgi:hypothetical protein